MTLYGTNRLVYKLLQVGIGGPFYSTIKSMYSKSTGSIRSLNVLSTPFPIEKGVHQGYILIPFYKLFINDLVIEFKRPECTPPELIGQEVHHLVYADDLVILSTSSSGLQESLNNLNSYCRRWMFEINSKKSKVMCMSKSGKKEQRNIPYWVTLT